MALLLLLATLTTPKGTELSAVEIMTKLDDLYRGASSHAVLTMEVATEHWSRTLTMEAWSQGTEKSLIRILKPKKERGTATLKSDKDIWNFLPKVKRIIKLPSSMMGASWMGSHFTNDDLVREDRFSEDYSAATTSRGEREGHAFVTVTGTPGENSAVVWGKIEFDIRTGDWQPLEVRYFDEEGSLSRTLAFSNIRQFGKRKVPATMTMRVSDKPKESTIIIYESLDFKPKLNSDMFTLRNLKRQ